MAGIATITNPANSKEILLFHNTANQHLALETRPTKSKNATADYSVSSTEDAGNIFQTSALAAIRQNDLATVYGIETKSVGSPATNVSRIALLSPVYRPLPGLVPESAYRRLAAVSNDDGEAWLYYRTTALKQIVEFPLSNPDGPSKTLTPSNIGNSTYIAAYIDTTNNERHVIYQDDTDGDDDATVHDYNITLKSRDHISNVNPISTTPLAAAYISAKSATYLYYLVQSGKHYKLRRVIRDSSGKWGSAAYPSGAADASGTTQISVVVGDEGKVNHVFYTDSTNKIVHFDDKWV